VKEAANKEVVTKESLAVAEFDTGNDRPVGLENVTSRDLLIPRLTILQALSPQLQRRRPEYIENAKAGEFCDVGLNEVFGSSLILLPCYFARVYLEWGPRGSDKGLIANHGTDASIMEKTRPDENKRSVLPNGNYIAETATYFCLNLSANGRKSFIPLASTQLGASRRWMMKLTAERVKRPDGTEFVPPIFYRTWQASVAEQTNNQGTWFGWTFSPGKTILDYDPTKNLLNEAKKFYASAAADIVKGEFNQEIEESTAESGQHADSEKAVM
jgi:hypothetical protein